MQTSSSPKKLPVPFADAGSKQDIPLDSQIGITGGRASYTDGFPPLTRTPLSAGGIPPFGTDFNGVLNDITASIRWQNAGSNYPFDGAFAASVAGYPKGAVIPSSLYDGYWLNTTEANSANPEVTNGSLTGWVPVETYGVTTVAGLAASSVTLTSLQAAKERIRLTGTLTSNINIVVPAWAKKWTVVNNCAGSFSVTIKTPAGTGVLIPTGMTAQIVGDGTNITQDTNIIGFSGRLLNIQTFTTSGTYTPTPGTSKVRVKQVGGGGAGGGTLTTTSAQVASGNGGNGGTFGDTGLMVVPTSSVAVTIGTAGVGSAGGNGGSGGNTSFGAYLISPGGAGGGAGAAGGAGSLASDNVSNLASTGTNVSTTIPGDKGTGAFNISVQSNGIKSGGGGDSQLGIGGGGINGTTSPRVGVGYGAGGSGNAAGPGASLNIAGANGTAGICIIEEYA
jgi:hypothetical protein